MNARVPPHNLAAEEALIGAMILSPDAVSTAAEILTVDDFYKPAHGHVFDAITTLASGGNTVDAVTVSTSLQQAGLLDAVGGSMALMSLQANTPSTSNAASYAKLIEEASLLRRMIGAASEIAEVGYSAPSDVTEALDDAERMIYSIAQRQKIETTAASSDLVGPLLDAIEFASEHAGQMTGVPSGFADLDDIMWGLQPGTLNVVGGRPACGKSSWALNVVSNIAIHSKKPVLMFSLEMGKIELMQRLVCAEGRVDSTRVRKGELTDRDWSGITSATAKIHDAPIFIDDNANTNIAEIRGKSRRLKSKMGGLGLIVIDYLQLMTGRSNAENRQTEVAEISRGLKLLARELETPVLALTQLNRSVEQRFDKRPVLSDIRESGAIEMDADTVMFLYRDEMYDKDSPDKGTAELILAKHRAGPIGVIRLAYLSQYTKFENMEQRNYDH